MKVVEEQSSRKNFILQDRDRAINLHFALFFFFFLRQNLLSLHLFWELNEWYSMLQFFSDLLNGETH